MPLYILFSCRSKNCNNFFSHFILEQGVELHQNNAAGILLTDQSLVLQFVSRTQAGDYTCLAANTEGKGTSNPVTLRVQCK